MRSLSFPSPPAYHPDVPSLALAVIPATDQATRALLSNADPTREVSVCTLRDAGIVVVDLVDSASLVKGIETQGSGIAHRIAALFEPICHYFEEAGGLTVERQGDSVHFVFSDCSLLSLCKLASALVAKNLTAEVRVGLTIGNCELVRLTTSRASHLQLLGSAVNDAFRAASGEGAFLCSGPGGQVYRG